MTMFGEIGKIYRDSVENLRENVIIKSKFCSMADFEDFPLIFYQTAELLTGGILVKYELVKRSIFTNKTKSHRANDDSK